MTHIDKYDYQLRSLRVPGGVGTTADYSLHKTRRQALTPFFSKRNVLHLESSITEKVEQLCQLIAKHAAEETPVNLSDSFFAFSNEYGFDTTYSRYNANKRKRCNKLLIRPSD